MAGPLMPVASFELQLVSLLPVWCTMSDLVGQPVAWGYQIPVKILFLFRGWGLLLSCSQCKGLLDAVLVPVGR